MSAVGITSYMANAWLNWVRGTAGTPPSGIYAKLHTGVPGAAGTLAAAAGNTARQPIAFAAASGGAISITGTAPTWNNTTASNSETLSHVSFHDAPTGGNCLWTAALNSSRQWSTGDTYTLSTDALNLSPLAAD